MLEIVRTLKIVKALQMHPYKITPPKAEDGRWQTLLFKIGTRLGELVATIWEDMEDDNIHIQRMEANASEMIVDDKKLSFTKPKNAIIDHLKRKNDCEDRFHNTWCDGNSTSGEGN